jgi:hypothetical protein
MNSIRSWITTHPNLSAWFVLALGMVAILVYEARDVGLETRQWFWLVVITVLVAGACIWIRNCIGKRRSSPWRARGSVFPDGHDARFS